MAGKNTLVVNSLNFDAEVIKSTVPVLVDFTATWCGPCKAIAPIVDELADTYAGKAKVAKLDIDEAQDISVKYGVRGVPTLLVFKNGEVVAKQVGAAPKNALVAFFEKNL